MAIDWNQSWAPMFLLRIDARGSYTYLATEPVVLTDAAGNEYAHQSGLQPLEWSYKLNLGEFSASSDTVSVQFTNPFNEDFAHAVNCYALDLATLQGELSLYVNGAYEDRVILASGRLQRLRWGYEGDSIEAQILVNPFRFQRLIPPVPQVVDARRWENAPENVLGAQYPWVFGSPGNSSKPSHPALNVDTNKWLVAGHALSDATAYVFNRTTGATTTKAISTEADGRGQTVSTISYTAAADDEVWVSVEGGLAGSNPADQLAYCLDAAGIPYQQSTLAGLRGVLSAYRTGFVLNDQTDAWGLAQDRLLSLLPLSMQTIGNVVDFRHVKPVPTAQDVVCDWDVQRGDCTLVQRPELVENDICNRVTLTYAPDPSANTAVTLIVTGLGETADSDAGLSVSPNALADLSQGRLGKFDKQLSTDAVWDAATAGRVAHDAIDLFALPAIEVSYDLHPSLGRYKIGDVVRLTDSDFAWSNKGFRIVELTYSLAGVSARLRSIEHPSWQQLATCAAPTFPDEPDGNLLRNPSAESSMTYWVEASGPGPGPGAGTTAAVAYGTAGTVGAADPGPTERGNYLFVNTSGATDTILQIITLADYPAAAAAVATGSAVCNFSGWFGGPAGASLNISMRIYMVRADLSATTAAATSYVSGSQPVTGLEYKYYSHFVPATTVYLYVYVTTYTGDSECFDKLHVGII